MSSVRSNSTMYCCSGSTPKTYLTSKSRISPSSPSVWTMNRGPSRNIRLVKPSCSIVASSKSPSTVSSVAKSMARSWWDPVKASACSW